MNPVVGMADLARLAARLPRTEAHDAARSLRLATLEPAPPPRDEATTEAAVPPSPEAHFAAAAAAVATERIASKGTPAAFWRVERFDPAPEAPDERPRTPPLDLTDPLLPHERGGSLFPRREPPMLTPWRRLWPTLHHALRSEVPGKDVDTVALVARWSRGEMVREIPFLRRRQWATRAAVWIDQSPHLLPLWPDQRAVERRLRRVFRRALQVRWLGRAAASRALDAPRGWLEGVRLDATTPVVVLGDLGLLGGAHAATWRSACATMAAAGVRVTAVVPWATRRHRARRVRGCAVLPWEHGRAMGDGRDTADGDDVSARLLRCAAMAMSVPPGMLRELRWRVPGADVEDELRVWNDGAVADADDSVMVLRAEALEALRKDFVEKEQALHAGAGEVIDRWREGMRHELVYGETLDWCAAGASIDAAPGDITAANAFAERLVAVLEGGSARAPEAWKLYTRGMLEGVTAGAYREREVLARLWEVAHEGIEGAVPPEGIDVEALRARRRGRAAARVWALRHVGDALVVSGRNETRWPSEVVGAGSPLAVLEAAGAEVIVDDGVTRIQRVLAGGRALPLPSRAGASVAIRGARGTLHARPWAREPWATAAGRDAYGLWAEVTAAGVPFRMRWVPPGRFVMGSPEGEAGRWSDEGPQHEVVLTQGYWLGETPVTQGLWEAVMGSNPSEFKSADRPVEQVSWKDCEAFVRRLNERVAGLDARLPTESEWEHACRAGTTNATWAGNLEIVGERNAPLLDEIAWYGGNSGRGFELSNGYDTSNWREKQYPDTRAGTHPVGRKRANPLGLYDMLGNVLEWCSDWFGNYSADAKFDPTGSKRGAGRVLRGGSWGSYAGSVRAAARHAVDPGDGVGYIGFRLTRGQAALQTAGQGEETRDGREGGTGSRKSGAEGSRKRR